MCGIFGYRDFNSNPLSNDVLENMSIKINHRGPDGVGIYHDEEQSLALGNVRLAIIDVEHGQQPFFSDDKKIVVVQNGEIFNHIELAKELADDGFTFNTTCDTEVILRLYERDGISGLSKMNGMFAISIYDKNEDKLFLIRDRVGEKPLHYYFDGKRIVYSSEIKGILPAIENVKLSFTALEQFFSFNYVPEPYTLFEKVFHVSPGTYLEINKNGIQEHQWWGVSDLKVQDFSESEWITRFNKTLADATAIRLRADVPFGAFLSGGVDSSTVVGLMTQSMDQPVKTYSIGFDDPKYDESPYALEAAKRFNTQHVSEIVEPNMLNLWEQVIYHCDQPHGDVSFMPTYRVAELASRDVKMVLTGDGADELFAGYDKYKEFFSNSENLNLSDSEFISRYANNISLFSSDSLKKLFSPFIQEKISCTELVDRVSSLTNEANGFDRINQALYIDTKLLLSGNNLVKPDRMGMAVSIENRAPFLDYRLIELAFQMPGELKLKNGETKYIYKKAVSDLIGSSLAYRKKQMFTVPIGDWFKSELKPLCEDLLLSERTVSRGIFNYDFIEELLQDHCAGVINNTREIRALMAFELWCREFLD
ncbi:asparagine synthase (glutamine-hydrolyzing) [Photobacterium sp. 2_MG-2023]|uniref:asparagine synthase (glutamine-hydrolyzing) n=1 Tax=Photobacterium sp. 2_MG-2023 TaxID=3062663 RepID=UPI0026E37666|nr:asparagine synthase (glutamine-hydrolyzing) [Photobacterium sp. 2_MG-2023]MDO6579744.1 asparagine synthase (glutamine-hydrolyzing) [Photobacterium sp. 2_MG-2023]